AMTKATAEAAAKACMAKAPPPRDIPLPPPIPPPPTPPPAASAEAETVKARASPTSAGKKNLCIIAFSAPSTRLGARRKERCFILGVRARIGDRPRHFVADLGKNEQKNGTGDGS